MHSSEIEREMHSTFFGISKSGPKREITQYLITDLLTNIQCSAILPEIYDIKIYS